MEARSKPFQNLENKQLRSEVKLNMYKEVFGKHDEDELNEDQVRIMNDSMDTVDILNGAEKRYRCKLDTLESIQVPRDSQSTTSKKASELLMKFENYFNKIEQSQLLSLYTGNTMPNWIAQQSSSANENYLSSLNNLPKSTSNQQRKNLTPIQEEKTQFLQPTPSTFQNKHDSLSTSGSIVDIPQKHLKMSSLIMIIALSSLIIGMALQTMQGKTNNSDQTMIMNGNMNKELIQCRAERDNYMINYKEQNLNHTFATQTAQSLSLENQELKEKNKRLELQVQELKDQVEEIAKFLVDELKIKEIKQVYLNKN